MIAHKASNNAAAGRQTALCGTRQRAPDHNQQNKDTDNEWLVAALHTLVVQHGSSFVEHARQNTWPCPSPHDDTD
jgi:hypothetical protein